VVAGFAASGAILAGLTCPPRRAIATCLAVGATAGAFGGVVTVATGGAGIVLGGAATAAATNAGDQWLTTGRIDPGDVATAAVIGAATGALTHGALRTGAALTRRTPTPHHPQPPNPPLTSGAKANHVYSSGGLTAREGNLLAPRLSIGDARAAAESQGLSIRSIDLRLRTEGMPGYWEDAYGSTPFGLRDGDLVPMRAADGRFIVELQSAALQSDQAAVMTISHELQHLRQWMSGNPLDEGLAEGAAEQVVRWWRG
jgi:hypothetical protein